MEKGSLEKIKDVFKKAPVEVVYLFGSHQKGGYVTPLSDYDFAVLAGEHLSKGERLDLMGNLMDKLSPICGYDKADVVTLEDSPLELKFNAIGGEILLDKDPARRVEFETDTMRRYHDQKYFFDKEFKIMLKQLRGGIFFDRGLLSYRKTA